MDFSQLFTKGLVVEIVRGLVLTVKKRIVAVGEEAGEQEIVFLKLSCHTTVAKTCHEAYDCICHRDWTLLRNGHSQGWWPCGCYQERQWEHWSKQTPCSREGGTNGWQTSHGAPHCKVEQSCQHGGRWYWLGGRGYWSGMTVEHKDRGLPAQEECPCQWDQGSSYHKWGW